MRKTNRLSKLFKERGREIGILSVALLLIASFTVLYLFFSSPKTSKLKFQGVQIYRAVSKAEYLQSHGFDFRMRVTGRNLESETVTVEGEIMDTGDGFFLMNSSRGMKIVEGPAGKQDIRAQEIVFLLENPKVVEVVHPPFNNLSSFIDSLDKYRKAKGTIAVDTERRMDPTFFQQIENFDQNIYSSTNTFLHSYSNGVRFKLTLPVETGEMIDFLKELDRKCDIKEIKTGEIYFYRGVKSDEEFKEVKRSAEEDAFFRLYPGS